MRCICHFYNVIICIHLCSDTNVMNFCLFNMLWSLNFGFFTNLYAKLLLFLFSSTTFWITWKLDHTNIKYSNNFHRLDNSAISHQYKPLCLLLTLYNTTVTCLCINSDYFSHPSYCKFEYLSICCIPYELLYWYFILKFKIRSELFSNFFCMSSSQNNL